MPRRVLEAAERALTALTWVDHAANLTDAIGLGGNIAALVTRLRTVDKTHQEARNRLDPLG